MKIPHITVGILGAVVVGVAVGYLLTKNAFTGLSKAELIERNEKVEDLYQLSYGSQPSSEDKKIKDRAALEQFSKKQLISEINNSLKSGVAGLAAKV